MHRRRKSSTNGMRAHSRVSQTRKSNNFSSSAKGLSQVHTTSFIFSLLVSSLFSSLVLIFSSLLVLSRVLSSSLVLSCLSSFIFSCLLVLSCLVLSCLSFSVFFLCLLSLCLSLSVCPCLSLSPCVVVVVVVVSSVHVCRCGRGVVWHAVCTFKTSPCVPAPRPHVVITCGRGGGTHGGRFECTHGGGAF